MYYSIELALAATIAANELLIIDAQASCAQAYYTCEWVLAEWS